ECVGIPKLDDKMTSNDAIIKLCKLTKSKECSRLQRALDILIKHGRNINIKYENGKKQSNTTELEISKDDIYSLQLLKISYLHYIIYFNEFLKESVYKSIYIQTKNNENYFNFSIYALYKLVTIEDTSAYGNKRKTEPYITQTKNEIKKYLSEIKNMKSMSIRDIVKESYILEYLITRNSITINEFTNNVLQNYLKSTESIISCITGISSYKDYMILQENKKTSYLEYSPDMSDIVKYTNNNSNIQVNFSSSVPINTQSHTNSWNIDKIIKILEISFCIFIIILIIVFLIHDIYKRYM
ncbi:hypothetical protein NEIRO03_2685, partial [Nematocida sp. AWRm78]